VNIVKIRFFCFCSGTLKFLEGISQNKSEKDLIGQFGVGFYSAFLVSDEVTVISKRLNGKQYRWRSLNATSFSVVEDTGEDLIRGTKVILHLKDSQFVYLLFYM
jgi:molecular chaperone HtpG